MIEVKICENCRHQNPVVALECEKCGYDLTFVYPQKIDPERSDEEPQTVNGEESKGSVSGWIMVATSDESQICAIDSEISVGRDCSQFSEQFNSSNYTSRVHAKLRIKDNMVQVMDASTNGTFVDDKRINKMEWVNVPENSVIRFADVTFRIRRTCNAD